jgi:hypothetical protein
MEFNRATNSTVPKRILKAAERWPAELEDVSCARTTIKFPAHGEVGFKLTAPNLLWA